jgi:hypothetical protein
MAESVSIIETGLVHEINRRQRRNEHHRINGKIVMGPQNSFGGPVHTGSETFSWFDKDKASWSMQLKIATLTSSLTSSRPCRNLHIPSGLSKNDSSKLKRKTFLDGFLVLGVHIRFHFTSKPEH